MQKRPIIAVTVTALALSIPSLAGAVADPVAAPDPRILDGTAQQELNAARTAWKAYGHRHYRMRIRTDCFCSPDIRRARAIEVLDGKPVEAAPAHLRSYATVRRLFARVQDAIDDRVAGLTAEYDAHGVPRMLFVDVSHDIADEEHGVRIVRFRALD